MVTRGCQIQAQYGAAVRLEFNPHLGMKPTEVTKLNRVVMRIKWKGGTTMSSLGEG